MAVPGAYTVKLTARGKTLTQPLNVVKDPGSAGTEADMQAQLGMMLQIRDEVSEIADMVNHLEWVRKEIADRRLRIESDPLRGSATRGKGVQGEDASALAALEKKATPIQNKLEDVTLTGRTEDSFRAPMGLYGKYLNLAGEVSGGGDMKPTDSARAVHKVLQQQLAQIRTEFNELRETNTSTLNER